MIQKIILLTLLLLSSSFPVLANEIMELTITENKKIIHSQIDTLCINGSVFYATKNPNNNNKSKPYITLVQALTYDKEKNITRPILCIYKEK